MAGDWIKMRSDLYRDPKVSVMADALMRQDGELATFVSQNCRRDMTVTRNVMRNVTVGALVSVWGVMRQRGKRRDDDLICDGVTPSVLDDISDLPGFGDAMARAGWVVESEHGIEFPRFFEDYNVAPEEKSKEKNADRQRRFRERQKESSNAESNDQSNAPSNVTNNVTVTHREEKRREEKESPLTPGGGGFVPEGFQAFWDAWPKNHRKGAKEKCLEHWRKSRLEGQASTILAHVRAMASTVDWTKENRQFVPAPIVYLRSGAWSGADIGLPTGMFDGAI